MRFTHLREWIRLRSIGVNGYRFDGKAMAERTLEGSVESLRINLNEFAALKVSEPITCTDTTFW
jgi:hypothetical protein